MHEQQFMGKGFFWWQGVVEDRHDEAAEDELKLGRVRVRIIGIHSPHYKADEVGGEGIEVGQLHWAFPMMPVTSAGIDGIGQTPLGLVEGSWVFGFSRDGEFSQDLVIIGSAGGYQEEAKNPNFDGFCDPELSGVAVPERPKTDYREAPYPSQLGESSVNRLAMNDEPHAILDVKEENRLPYLAVPIALDGIWTQPEIQYDAKYPFNHVRESESGHIEEWDDTPGAERVHRWHRSGTYSETYPDGKRTQQIVADDYETVKGTKHIIAEGNVTITAMQDVQVMAHRNINMEALDTVNIVAGVAINLSAPLINEVSNLHTITTGTLEVSAGLINFTTGLFNIYSPLTNIFGNLYVLMHTQSGTMGTGFLWAGFIVTGGCAGCC